MPVEYHLDKACQTLPNPLLSSVKNIWIKPNEKAKRPIANFISWPVKLTCQPLSPKSASHLQISQTLKYGFSHPPAQSHCCWLGHTYKMHLP
ncbi:hypothetical protein [Bartonella raoultii]|uniref:hypothetical protein n=1 Tax=Bartonella raoultii TaxID=1457020 RepID=UPI001FEE6D3B|nr:hypothetical protein [Bartonella raoultii]